MNISDHSVIWLWSDLSITSYSTSEEAELSVVIVEEYSFMANYGIACMPSARSVEVACEHMHGNVTLSRFRTFRHLPRVKITQLPCRMVPSPQDDLTLLIASASRTRALPVSESKIERMHCSVKLARREAAARRGNSCNLVRRERSLLPLRSSSAVRSRDHK